MAINQLLKRMSDFYPPLQSGDLLLSAKHLFVAAMVASVGRTMPGSANCYERGGVPAKFGPRFAWPHKCLRNELNKTEYEPNNDRSIYYGRGYLIPAFHGIERTFSWLLSLPLDAPLRQSAKM
jgi:hypothetical protein